MENTKTQTPQQQKAGTLIIMPGIGCLTRRLYIEHYLSQKRHLELEPCIVCAERSNCKKIEVHFQ